MNILPFIVAKIFIFQNSESLDLKSLRIQVRTCGIDKLAGGNETSFGNVALTHDLLPGISLDLVGVLLKVANHTVDLDALIYISRNQPIEETFFGEILIVCDHRLVGKHHGESDEAQRLGLRIVTYMRDAANRFSDRYQHNYSVLATPAEGLSGKFTRRDRKDFGSIAGITDRDYYTNSNHVPVYYKCSARHKAEVEAPYHDLTRGGHIFYVEMDGDATHNPEAIMRVVDMMDRYNMGYGSVNHTRNRCLDCGYENATARIDVCPRCGGKRIDRLQRITGYLVGTTDRWNNAKLAELNDRVIHAAE